LLVEDQELLRKAFTTALKRKGYEVSAAVDGVEALEKIREVRPDLIFLDILMPRMTGVEVLERLKNDPTLPKCKVIITSNSSIDMDLAEAKRMGADGMYIKANHSLSEFCEQAEIFLKQAEEKESHEKDFAG
jgi:CheY-like chemotaxis protein